MDDVIENCVVTFEEDGVERKLLDEVKKVRATGRRDSLSDRKFWRSPRFLPVAHSIIALCCALCAREDHSQRCLRLVRLFSNELRSPDALEDRPRRGQEVAGCPLS